MHYVSTIFTTIGYGGVTPVTFGANHILDINILDSGYYPEWISWFKMLLKAIYLHLLIKPNPIHKYIEKQSYLQHSLLLPKLYVSPI